MNIFEVWEEKHNKHMQGIGSIGRSEAFKAGMLAAADIAEDVDTAGEDAFSIREQIFITIRDKAEEI